MKRASDNNLKTDILFIDTWRVGIKLHYLPIYKYLQSLHINITIKALHRESLYARGESIPKIDCIDGLECYDISYFPWRRNLERIIRQFNPRIVMLLTHSFLFDRAIIRLCRRMGIRTIFLQHGAVRFSPHKPKQKPYLLPAIYLDKARRYLSYYLPVYFRVTAPEDPLCMLRPDFLRFLFGSLILNYTLVPPKPTSEVRADQALVYGEFYAEKFKRLHGYQDNQVHIVGNLTFDSMVDIAKKAIVERESWLRARRLDPTRRMITYLPQPFVEEGYVGKSEFQRYLGVLGNQVKEKELNLIIKLHPRNDIALFRSLMDKEFIAIEEKDLVESVYFSDAVVGHFSTALGLAIVAYKPLIIVDTFKSMSGSFGDPEDLKSVAHVVTTQNKLGNTLENLSNNDWKCDRSAYNDWKRKYSHFDPKEKVVQRIAKYLIAEYKALTENIGEE